MIGIIVDVATSFVKGSIKGIIGLGILWIMGIFIERCFEKNIMLQQHHNIIRGVARTIKYFCIFLGIIVFLKDIGIDLQGVVTGLGLTGFTVGFALKDTISNLVAGAFILMYRPFYLGDYIIVSTDKLTVEGKVRSIDFRYTTLQTDNGPMLIPNNILYTNIITIKNK